MKILTANPPILDKTRELCSAIAQSPLFAELQGRVERFLDDDDSRNQYREVHLMGEQLHQKQHAGMELGSEEIRAFETARDDLFANPVASAFLDARGQLERLQQEIGKFLGLTLELGRVPTDDDLADAGGCCGGGGCGCHDGEEDDEVAASGCCGGGGGGGCGCH